jgi:hypothetical protein
MPLREWLKPPRTLLAILSLVTLVSVSALLWFGWKLLDQERIVEAQRAQERLEQAADRIAAIAHGALAETGERVGAWLIAPPQEGKPEEGLLLITGPGGISATPRDRLLYRPPLPLEAEDAGNAFIDGETFEFQQALPERAIGVYRQLSESKNPSVQAGALIRLARVQRKTGHPHEAAAAYARILNSGVGGERVAGVPAELIARHALAELSGLKADAELLRQDLLRGRWQLTRGQFGYYWSEASRLAGDSIANRMPPEATVFSEVVDQGWEEINTEPGPRGQTTIWVDRHPWFLIWRGSPARRAVLITRPESILKPIFPTRRTTISPGPRQITRAVWWRVTGTGRDTRWCERPPKRSFRGHFT